MSTSSDRPQGSRPSQVPGLRYLTLWAWAAIPAWSGLIGGLLAWNVARGRGDLLDTAREMAQTAWDEDTLVSRWITSSGGIYASQTMGARADPYLSGVPENTVATPSGRVLHLMHPAHAMRQMHAAAGKMQNNSGHVVGLQMTRPEDNPDEWEERALLAIQGGAKDVLSLAEIDGTDYVRLLSPVAMDGGCVACHAAQGHANDAIQAGLSVSVPITSLVAAQRADLARSVLGYSSLWLVGLGFLGFGYAKGRRALWLRMQADAEIRRSETRFRTLYESSSDAVMMLDERGFFDCNESTVRVFGCRDKAEFCAMHPADASPAHQPSGADSHSLAGQRIATAMDKGSLGFEWVHKRVDTGAEFPAEVLLSRMTVDGRYVLQATVRDVTARKQAEKEREGLIEQLTQSLAEVKQLSGLLPICMYCKNIRDDKGYWQRVEQYVGTRSGATFTHGLCPTCEREHFPADAYPLEKPTR
jgi:PAS domain S-box-containing protein